MAATANFQQWTRSSSVLSPDPSLKLLHCLDTNAQAQHEALSEWLVCAE